MEELLLLAFAASITLEILCTGKKKKSVMICLDKSTVGVKK